MSRRFRGNALAGWLAPSVVGALGGVLVAGAIEGAGMADVVATLATVGFIGMVGGPVVFAASAIARGLVRAWQPEAIAIEHGGAPRLAGWVATLWLGLAALAAIELVGTRLLGSRTRFVPIEVALAQPVIAVAGALAVVACSRPVALGLAGVARRVDAVWRRRGRRSLLAPRAIVAIWLAVTIIAIGAVWRGVRWQLGPIDTSALEAPAAGLAAAIGLQAVWKRLGRARLITGAAIAALSVAAIVIAVVVRVRRPVLVLEIWGERAVAGVAIDALFDLEHIRAGISIEEFRPVARPDVDHPDIVLVTIDTVRADHTAPYGGAADMPGLAELAARGAVFEWAFAPSNVTRRSIPSMVIGLAPDRVRGRVVGWALRVDPRHVLLAERLRAGGYDTAGFQCCEGFWGPEANTGLQRGLAHLEIEHDGHKLAERAAAWMAGRGAGRPMFLWMHLLEPHNWTAASGAGRSDEERRRLYDRSLEDCDAMLRELLRGLGGRAPIVIVTADHGEALGDHGHAFHSTDLYNSQLRVPLVMAGPGVAAVRVPEVVSTTDLVPTVLELAGFEPPAPPVVDGRSFAALASGRRAGEAGKGTAFAAMIKDRSNPGGVRALIDGRWKLVENSGAVELYDLGVDPDERVDVAGREPAIVVRLRALLAARDQGAARSMSSR